MIVVSAARNNSYICILSISIFQMLNRKGKLYRCYTEHVLNFRISDKKALLIYLFMYIV